MTFTSGSDYSGHSEMSKMWALYAYHGVHVCTEIAVTKPLCSLFLSNMNKGDHVGVLKSYPCLR